MNTGQDTVAALTASSKAPEITQDGLVYEFAVHYAVPERRESPTNPLAKPAKFAGGFDRFEDVVDFDNAGVSESRMKKPGGASRERLPFFENLEFRP